jgi:hypothetical protein
MNENSPVVGVIDEGSSIREGLSNLLRSAELRNLGVKPTTLIARIEKMGLRRPV